MFKGLVEKVYRRAVFSRHDADDAVYYFTAKDFEGLRCEPYSFENQLGERLSGAFYYYDGFRADRLIIFDHGMGMGHYSYMNEIETICRHGFRVFSYDHTGCTNSEGAGIRGLSGSLADLDACICALKKDGVLSGLEYSVVGHSWGGFSAMNVIGIHKDVHSMVAISGFISVKDMQKQSLSGLAAQFRGITYRYEKSINGDYVDSSAIDVLSKTKIPSLIIHSLDDNIVSAHYHFLKLKKAIEGLPEGEKPPVSFVSMVGKFHNPNYTEDAVRYKNKFIKELTKKKKKKRLETKEQREAFKNSYDWKRMTRQDERVWSVIFEHLDK